MPSCALKISCSRHLMAAHLCKLTGPALHHKLEACDEQSCVHAADIAEDAKQDSMRSSYMDSKDEEQGVPSGQVSSQPIHRFWHDHANSKCRHLTCCRLSVLHACTVYGTCLHMGALCAILGQSNRCIAWWHILCAVTYSVHQAYHVGCNTYLRHRKVAADLSHCAM